MSDIIIVIMIFLTVYYGHIIRIVTCTLSTSLDTSMTNIPLFNSSSSAYGAGHRRPWRSWAKYAPLERPPGDVYLDLTIGSLSKQSLRNLSHRFAVQYYKSGAKPDFGSPARNTSVFYKKIKSLLNPSLIYNSQLTSTTTSSFNTFRKRTPFLRKKSPVLQAMPNPVHFLGTSGSKYRSRKSRLDPSYSSVNVAKYHINKGSSSINFTTDLLEIKAVTANVKNPDQDGLAVSSPSGLENITRKPLNSRSAVFIRRRFHPPGSVSLDLPWKHTFSHKRRHSFLFPSQTAAKAARRQTMASSTSPSDQIILFRGLHSLTSDQNNRLKKRVIPRKKYYKLKSTTLATRTSHFVKLFSSCNQQKTISVGHFPFAYTSFTESNPQNTQAAKILPHDSTAKTSKQSPRKQVLPSESIKQRNELVTSRFLTSQPPASFKHLHPTTMKKEDPLSEITGPHLKSPPSSYFNEGSDLTNAYTPEKQSHYHWKLHLQRKRSTPRHSGKHHFLRRFTDARSTLLPTYQDTGGEEAQHVVFQVVVHLSADRDQIYARELNSAISRSAVLSTIKRFIQASGKLVLVKNDTPRHILQTFCEDILLSNTTAVFHLINPFYHARSWSSAQYMSNLLSTLKMPIITWGPEYIGTTDKKESDNYQLNISPTLHYQAEAMLGVLRHYNWSHFAVVYTPVPGHDVFLTAIRILLGDNNNGQGVRDNLQFTILEDVKISNSSDNGTISKDLKVLTKTETRIILLYCMEKETLPILDQASTLGLLTEEYIWFLTFEAINKNRVQNANNLPLGLLGIYYEYMDDEMKHVINTAASIWLRGLQESLLASTKSESVHTGLPWSLPNLQCQSSKSLSWPDGYKFYDIMRNVSFDQVSFSDLGQLKFKNISIVNVQPPEAGKDDQKWRQVGVYTNNGIQMSQIRWPGGSVNPPLGKPKRHFLRIVTREEPPFVEYRPLNQNGTCGHFSHICHVYQRDENEVRISNTTVLRCCTGLSIDFLHRLSISLNFEFYLYEVEDYQWGIKMPDGTWNGIVGELRTGRADMVVASMTIDEDKSKAIDFSVPYMETGITFIVAIREGAISATAFLEPYDYPSWCLILVCSVHVTGASIFLFEWFSPYGLDKGKRLSSSHRFSLFRVFWLMWAMLFGAAVTTDSPRGVSSKFMSNIWALFALVFSASYTANLAAFMITKEEYYDLSGMQDWRLQNPHAMVPPFRFATIANGTTESNIKKNSLRMHEYMKPFTQRSVEQAMEALKNKLHAFIYDASVLEYQEGKDKDCRLITVGNWYAATGYGVGFPFKSPWLKRVNNVILQLQYEGEMERLKEFWLAGACHTKRKKGSSNRGIGNGVSSQTLEIVNFTSAFIFLATGTGLATIILVLEHCYFWFGRKRLKNWDKKGCCALISLSMGMSLSFEESVREAMDIHKQSKDRCKSPLCETKLWKVNYELRQARSEIDRLQIELARATMEGTNNIVWKYDPSITSSQRALDEDSKWDYANNGHRDDEEAVRVTLL